jgi:hypothetical protein
VNYLLNWVVVFRSQQRSSNQSSVFFIPLYCLILCIETLLTVEYSCACATVNSSFLFFVFIFYLTCFIFSRLRWVSHYVRHNNSTSLVKQWHICSRCLDLVVSAPFVKADCLTKFWGCVTQPQNLCEPIGITCSRSVFTTLLLFFKSIHRR